MSIDVYSEALEREERETERERETELHKAIPRGIHILRSRYMYTHNNSVTLCSRILIHFLKCYYIWLKLVSIFTGERERDRQSYIKPSLEGFTY
jgi:hypothetical protein